MSRHLLMAGSSGGASLGPIPDIDHDSIGTLKERGYTYPDVVVTAKCPDFQSGVTVLVAPFIRRGTRSGFGNVSVEDLDSPSGKFICGVDLLGNWTVSVLHNDKKSSALSPTFSSDVIIRSVSPRSPCDHCSGAEG
jgi:hypothetical protein